MRYKHNQWNSYKWFGTLYDRDFRPNSDSFWLKHRYHKQNRLVFRLRREYHSNLVFETRPTATRYRFRTHKKRLRIDEI